MQKHLARLLDVSKMSSQCGIYVKLPELAYGPRCSLLKTWCDGHQDTPQGQYSQRVRRCPSVRSDIDEEKKAHYVDKLPTST